MMDDGVGEKQAKNDCKREAEEADAAKIEDE